MIAMCTSKAKSILGEYNSHCASHGDSAQATTTTISDVFNLSSAFWTSDHTYALQPIDHIPVAEQRRLIELEDTMARCSEELQYCISDILHMYTFFEKRLKCLNFNIYSIISQSSFQSSQVIIDPSDNQMYLAVGKIFDSVNTAVIAQHHKEAIYAGISQAEYVFYRLHRILDVINNLISAYWSSSQHDREAHIQKALSCSKLPISVPRINKLSIQCHAGEIDMDDMQDEPAIDNGQFQCDYDISSDEATTDTSLTDLDTQSDEYD